MKSEEDIKKWKAEWYQRNKERICEQKRLNYDTRQKEYHKEKNKEWREQNKGYHKEYQKIWRTTEKGRKYELEYRKTHPSTRSQMSEKSKERNRERAAIMQDIAREFKAKLKQHYGCMNPDCKWVGELPPYCLDFHHVNPEDKKFSIGSNIHNLKRLPDEINKCVILCAVCHRMETWGDFDATAIPKCQLDENGNIVV